jgi:hypothetical protein
VGVPRVEKLVESILTTSLVHRTGRSQHDPERAITTYSSNGELFGRALRAS